MSGSRTFEIRITGDVSGVQGALGRAGKAAEDASARVGGLSNAGQAADAAFGGLSARLGGAGQALESFGGAGRAAAIALGAIATSAAAVALAGDQMTQSLAKLRSATGSTEAARDSFDRLYRLSLQTGTSVTATVDAFARFAVATRDIGATNDQVMKLVALIQQAGAVAGVSAEESNNAAVQLAQGLATGTLQWEELKSIAEQMPTLVQALARELGVTVGELRRMSSEGQLTADRVLPALLRASEAVRQEFEQLPPTMARGFAVLQEATTRFLQDLDRALGLSNAIARGLEAAGRGLDAARGRLLPSPAEQAVLDEAASQQRVDALRREMARLEPGVVASRRRGSIQAGAVGVAEAQAGVTPEQRMAELQQQLDRELAALETAQIRRLAIEREGDERAFADSQAAGARAAESQRQRDATALRTLRETLDASLKARREHEQRVAELEGLRGRGAITEEEFNLRVVQSRQLMEGRDANKAEPTPREGPSLLEALRRDSEREVDQLVRSVETPLERYQRRLNEIADVADRARSLGNPIPDETISRAADAALADLQRVEQGARDLDAMGRELGMTFSSAFEDAILKGKSFSEVLQSIAQDAARIVVRQTITAPLGSAATEFVKGFNWSSLWPFAAGGVMSSDGPLPLRRYAAGGIARSPQLAMFGEGSTPEAYVPLPDGRSIPVRMEGGGGSVMFAPTYNIDARGADGGVIPRLRAEMVAVARAANAELLDAIQRGGSAARIVGRRA